MSSVTTLLTMVRLLQDDSCPQFDRIRFADRMAEMFLVEDFEHKASAKIYSNLAVLENALKGMIMPMPMWSSFLRCPRTINADC